MATHSPSSTGTGIRSSASAVSRRESSTRKPSASATATSSPSRRSASSGSIGLGREKMALAAEAARTAPHVAPATTTPTTPAIPTRTAGERSRAEPGYDLGVRLWLIVLITSYFVAAVAVAQETGGSFGGGSFDREPGPTRRSGPARSTTASAPDHAPDDSFEARARESEARAAREERRLDRAARDRTWQAEQGRLARWRHERVDLGSPTVTAEEREVLALDEPDPPALLAAVVAGGAAFLLALFLGLRRRATPPEPG